MKHTEFEATLMQKKLKTVCAIKCVCNLLTVKTNKQYV